MEKFKESIRSLIIETSTNLPPDVRRALTRAQQTEASGTQSALAMQTIAINVDMACDTIAPICQDRS
jgi:fumarate hydratase class I